MHSSDLPDPTPWLTAGGLLLTDGTQFNPDSDTAWFDGYVGRLIAADVAALGFATQVVHAEIPARLVDACHRCDLILIEVAERAPFMAIIALSTSPRHASSGSDRSGHSPLTGRLREPRSDPTG